MSTRTPLASGLDASFRHVRLALSLWLFLLATALLSWMPLRAAFEPFDGSLFRETLLKGWDSWGMLSYLALRGREILVFAPVFSTVLLVGFLLHVFLTGGILRVLIADVERPVLRRLVSESAALFRQNLWATIRFGITLVLWEGLLVGIPVGIARKLAKDAPPHGPLATFAFWWMAVVGLVVFFNVLLRLDLARVALARGDAPTARGAYRVAGQRLSGSRGSAIGLLLFWLLAAFACQILFTRIGGAMNPGTDGAISGLLFVRQLGFAALMALRVGWWASLLAWERLRRPVAMPVAHWPAVPVPLSATA